mgnify:CR=1 FL=1
MRDELDSILKIITGLEGTLQARAEALCEAFSAKRNQMRDELQERAKTTADVGKNGSLYAPLFISQRVHRGTLELHWAEMHFPKLRSGEKTGKRYIYIPKVNLTDYSIPDLKRRARPFEQDLVVETEQQARQVRRAWHKVADLRRQVRKLRDRDEDAHLTG